jgi:hypothetical protein
VPFVPARRTLTRQNNAKWRKCMKHAALMTAALAPLLIASGLASAANLPGSFPGVTIDAKLIGGQEYEPLYARIAEWEKLTGAKVNIISKKNHFELDKEFWRPIRSNGASAPTTPPSRRNTPISTLTCRN